MGFMSNRIILLLAIVIAILLHPYAGNAQEEKVLYIVSVNDQHGNIDNYPRFSALLDSLRKQYPEIILVSAGDNRTGHPVNDRYPKISYPMTALMNHVHFDLSTLGNHEFDAGIEGLKNVIGWSNFDYVCANARFEDSLKVNVQPYKIIEFQGLKLGFIGGIQVGDKGIPDFHPRFAKGVTFKPLIEILPNYMFLRDSCDALFLLSHCGLEYDIEIAKHFQQFDAIFGGHTHKKIERTKLIGNTMITQAGKNLNYLTISVFYFVNGKIDYKAQQVFSIKDFEQEDSAVRKIVNEFDQLEIFSKIVGNNDADITEKESLGCLMADVIRDAGKTDMAFQNPGGVRLKQMPMGPICLKQVYQLDPFDNRIVKFTLTGAEIVEMIKKAYTKTGDCPMYCSGCRYTVKMNEYDQMEDITVKLSNGKPLKMNAKYTIVLNNYMASVYDIDKTHTGKELPMSSNEIMIEYLSHKQHINYSNVSRITIDNE